MLRFGPFRLLRARKLLLRDEAEVRLSSRALEILVALAERAGDIVRKDELMARVWPNAVVEENTLRVHVAALRKALADGQSQTRYIANIPNRGYCFVAEVQRRPPPSAPLPAGSAGKLPSRGVHVIGREGAVATLIAQLPQRRFVTVVGAGGMGKTTVALAVAAALAPAYAHGAWFVDLSSVEDTQLLPATFAGALGLSNLQADAYRGLLEALRDKHLLLVVDNCEHVLEALAPLLEGLLEAAPQLQVLATSREPLRMEGEWLHRLPALRFPEAQQPLSAAQALGYSAIELFVERATANADAFALTDGNAALAAELCRRLDGIPLAIELAAARIHLFGLRGLATHLAQMDAAFLELRHARRSVAQRHQTLNAMLQWSYQLLPEAERAMLRRWSVFRGGFTAESAAALLGDGGPGDVAQSEVLNGLAGLSAKSLLYSQAGEPVLFRMHGLTRAFAQQRLREKGALQRAEQRHAERMVSLLAQARADWLSLSGPEWLARHAFMAEDVQAAVVWALATPGQLPNAIQRLGDAWTLGDLLPAQLAEYEAVIQRALSTASDP
jgi:predicted ATPase/DNA-binding winged helix-turn-helix (wHTH) protein